MAKDITLGILYSGQLETQLVKSAKKIGGIKTIILTDDKNGPAQHFCDKFIHGNLKDKKLILENSKVNKIVHILYDNDISDDLKYTDSFSSSIPCPTVSTESTLSPLQILSRNSYLARFFQRVRLTIEVKMKKDTKTVK